MLGTGDEAIDLPVMELNGRSDPLWSMDRHMENTEVIFQRWGKGANGLGMGPLDAECAAWQRQSPGVRRLVRSLSVLAHGEIKPVDVWGSLVEKLSREWERSTKNDEDTRVWGSLINGKKWAESQPPTVPLVDLQRERVLHPRCWQPVLKQIWGIDESGELDGFGVGMLAWDTLPEWAMLGEYLALTKDNRGVCSTALINGMAVGEKITEERLLISWVVIRPKVKEGA